MKISFKILIAFFLFTILVTTVSFVYVKSAVVIEPAASVNGYINMNFFPENFTSIDVRRGNWDVEVIRSDSFFVQINGGDNLVNNYLKIIVIDSTLIIDIDSVMISDKFRFLRATIEMSSLKRLEVNNNVSYKLVDFDEKILDINLKTGRASLDNCQIKKLNINASGISKFLMSETTSIEELNYDVRDSAYIMAEGVKKINCLGIADLGVFVDYLNEDEVVINTSEKRKKITNQMTSYVDNLKWLMPMDSVLLIMDKDSLNFKLKDEEKQFLFEYLSEASFATYYNISGEDPDVESKQLIFSRGLLTDIIIKYFSFGELKSIHDKLEKSFNSQYGAIYKWKQPSYFGVSWDDFPAEYWRAPEQNTNDKYTSIQLHYNDSGWLSIYYSSPINSFWSSRSMNRMSYEIQKILSGLRSFPNIVESFTRFFNTPAREH